MPEVALFMWPRRSCARIPPRAEALATKSQDVSGRQAGRERPAEELAAAARRGEDLAGVATVVGVEGALQGLHPGLVVGAEEPVHVLGFVDADAVLAGERAAHLQAGAHDLGAGGLDAGLRAGLAGV